MRTRKKNQRSILEAKLSVRVFNLDNQQAAKAKVEIADEQQKTIAVPFNPASNAFEATVPAPARYSLKVSLKRHASQTRDIKLSPGEHEETFVLGPKGLPHFYRGRVKVPFEPLPDLIGVVLKEPDYVDRFLPKLEEAAKQCKLKREKTGENLRTNGLFVYRLSPNTTEAERLNIQEVINREEFVAFCSPLLKLFDQNATLLTDTLIVKFKSQVSEDQVSRITRELNLVLVRNVPYAGNTYQYRVAGPISYKLLDICERLMATGLVEYAEPDLWHTSENDQITPTDWLFPEQWDHPIINTPDAWQTLSDIDPNRTFGAPGIVIAVVDSGIDAAHPAFNGALTDGTPKVYQLFDFVSMVPNNNSPAGNHGTCCAGGASGRANDPSAVLTVNEGTAGMAGNCQLIGIKRSGPESRYADMYIWAGGFNPNSSIAGFPAPISPGADIITNSFGYSIGSPISGLMRDTFDFLTTYGRGGKGVIFFFSAGNQGAGGCTGSDGTLLRPWGMYTKCHSVTASTLNNTSAEVKASYSNFGPKVSFCAPSNSNCTGTHNPPNDYGAFTPTIQNTGNSPGRPTIQTTLSANAAAGGSTITVASTVGIAMGQAILIGDPGAADTEAHPIASVNAGLNQVTLSETLFDAHAPGTNVFVSQPDYINDFGGTSYSTPVCAGLAALMLSANRNLTWIEVRQLIRDTAVKIDPNNTNATGRWRDTAGLISTDPGYAGPFFSQWYGYGRINAAAAVDAASTYGFQRDVYIRDNLVDNGLAPSAGAFWEGVDIWVRNSNDSISPASYATHADSVHLAPIFGQDNFVYVRFKNIGALPSYPFFVRVYLTHWAGTEFIYPDNFIPTVRPSDPIPSPLTPGTYLIGEASVNSLASLADNFVGVLWDADLVPPKEVMVGAVLVKWHPCLLVEITPQDGFTPTGTHVWENNNLAQKNISITYPDDNDEFTVAGVAGNLKNRSKFLGFEITVQWPVPRSVPVYIRFLNRHVERSLLEELDRTGRKDLKADKVGDNVVFRLVGKKSVKFQVPNVGLLPFIVGGNVSDLTKRSKASVEILQFDDNGKPSGGLTFELRKKRRQLTA